MIPNVFSGFNGIPAMVARGGLTAVRVLAGQYNPINGIGLANTSLAFFCNRLFDVAILHVKKASTPLLSRSLILHIDRNSTRMILVFCIFDKEKYFKY